MSTKFVLNETSYFGKGAREELAVEIEKRGKPYIIDYTKNLIMPKEQYFKLTNFEEIERISDEELFSDLVATQQLHLSRKRILDF